MAKIRVTESQYTAIQESENVVEDFRTSINDAIRVLNAQFSRLAFASMADVMDGDIDLDVIEDKMTEFDKIHQTKTQRVDNFFEKLRDNENPKKSDEYYTEWIDVHTELNEKGGIMLKKIKSIQILVKQLKIIANIDVEQHFSDIETRKI